MDENLKKYIDELISEIQNELDEATATGNVAGYNVPGAFSNGGSKDKNRKKKIATQFGMKIVGKMDESFMSDLDIIKKGSKDITDFIKKVLSDKQYKEVRTDKEFHKYLKSFYNESVVTESKDEVNPKQLANLQRDIKKINPKIKVYISNHPVTKGKLQIELGSDHPSNQGDDREITKINTLLKKHTGDWRTGTMFTEGINESLNKSIFKGGKLYEPKGGSSLNGMYYHFIVDRVTDSGIWFSYNEKYKVAPYGIVLVQGPNLNNNELLNKMRFKPNRTGKAGVYAYILDGNYSPFRIPEKAMKQLIGIVVNAKDSANQAQANFYKDRLQADNVNPSDSPSINEAKVIDIVDRFLDVHLPDVTYLNKKPYTGLAFFMNGFNGYDSSKSDGFLVDSKTNNPLTDKKGNILRSKKHRSVELKFKNGVEQSGRFNESINEAKVQRPVNRWLELKNDETMHPHKKMAMGLKELKYQLGETQKFFNWYNKIKTMNELDSSDYWKRTQSHIYKIKERLVNIARTIKEIEK